MPNTLQWVVTLLAIGAPLQEGDMLILLGTKSGIADAEAMLLAGRR